MTAGTRTVRRTPPPTRTGAVVLGVSVPTGRSLLSSVLRRTHGLMPTSGGSRSARLRPSTRNPMPRLVGASALSWAQMTPAPARLSMCSAPAWAACRLGWKFHPPVVKSCGFRWRSRTCSGDLNLLVDTDSHGGVIWYLQVQIRRSLKGAIRRGSTNCQCMERRRRKRRLLRHQCQSSCP